MKNSKACHTVARAKPGPRAELIEPRVLFSACVAGNSTVFATIQAAVNAAPVGGTVTVDAGTYAEQVTVSKSLTIDGAEAGVDASTGPRITASDSTETYVTGATNNGVVSSAFHVLASDVTINGFTVTGETNQDDELGAGIVIGPKLSGTHILYNVIRNNVSGLFLANYSSTDAAVIEHNYFGYNNNPGENGGRGIYTDGTISGGNLTNVTIDSNTFIYNRGGSGTTGLEAGIAFEAGNPGEQSNLRITGNTFTTNGKAVLFFNSTDVLIEYNTVTGSLDQFSGSLRFEGNNNTVSILYNNIHDNTGPGVAVDSSGTPGDSYGFVANDNNFDNNNSAYAERCAIAVDFSEYDGSFDARNNYYGDASGPGGEGSGSGDAVSNGVKLGPGWSFSTGGDFVYSPWATSPVTILNAVPTAPSGLAATSVSTSEIDLTWTAGAGQAAYAVDRSTDGGTTFTTIATPMSTTYRDTGLAASTAYTYRVRATNTQGSSPASNVVSATTAAATAPATVLSGTVIGTAGSYQNDGNTIGKAFDGNLNTFYDGAAPTGDWAGLDLGSATSIVQIAFAPRSGFASRMVGGIFQSSPSATFASGVVNLYTIAAAPLQGTLTTVSVAGASAQRYVRYLSPANSSGNVAEVVFYGSATATSALIPRTGTVIGTAGSYKNSGNTLANAVDGNVSTFFDGPMANGCWVGLDFGSVESVSRISYAPRSGYASRMLGGAFQSSTTADFSSGVTTLLTITASPPSGVLTTFNLASPVSARYFRYLSPDGSEGDVAEIVFYGPATEAPAVTPRAGTVIGTAGSYKGLGNTIANAVDGNLSTFFDGPMANGCWVGLDLGSVEAVSQISYAPRSGYASRMVGGVFQSSTAADFSSGVTTLFTITAAPESNVTTTVQLASPVTARYFRYLSPNGSEGDVAEVAFAG